MDRVKEVLITLNNTLTSTRKFFSGPLGISLLIILGVIALSLIVIIGIIALIIKLLVLLFFVWLVLSFLAWIGFDFAATLLNNIQQFFHHFKG
ncbi:hypothetical protein COTS27_01224 [Spirochaetota bacterium]|nr:hypothetical protein COTS27_01224 [Spirochaetota bacterium]